MTISSATTARFIPPPHETTRFKNEGIISSRAIETHSSFFEIAGRYAVNTAAITTAVALPALAIANGIGMFSSGQSAYTQYPVALGNNYTQTSPVLETSGACVQNLVVGLLGSLVTQSFWPTLAGLFSCGSGAAAQNFPYAAVSNSAFTISNSGQVFGPPNEGASQDRFFVGEQSLTGNGMVLRGYNNTGFVEGSQSISIFPGFTDVLSSQFTFLNQSRALLSWSNSSGAPGFSSTACDINGQIVSLETLQMTSDTFQIATNIACSGVSQAYNIIPLPNGNFALLWKDDNGAYGGGEYDQSGNEIERFSFGCPSVTGCFTTLNSASVIGNYKDGSYLTFWSCQLSPEPGTHPNDCLINSLNAGVSSSSYAILHASGLGSGGIPPLSLWPSGTAIASLGGGGCRTEGELFSYYNFMVMSPGSVGIVYTISLCQGNIFEPCCKPTGTPKVDQIVGVSPLDKNINNLFLTFLSNGFIAANWIDNGNVLQIFDQQSKAVTDKLQFSTNPLIMGGPFSAPLGGSKLATVWSVSSAENSPVYGQIFSLHPLPIVTAASSITTYTQGLSPIIVANTLSISDASSSNAQLTGANITISSNFIASDDVLSFSSQNGITGSYNSITGILTFTGVASITDYQALLRSVTYQDTSLIPTLPRTIQFSVSDELGYSTSLSCVVNVVPLTSITTSGTTIAPPPATTRASGANSNPSPANNNTAIVGGAAAGGVVVTGSLIGGLLYWWKNKKKQAVDPEVDSTRASMHFVVASGTDYKPFDEVQSG